MKYPIMKKRIVIIATIAVLLLYFFSNCNSRKSLDTSSIPTDSITIVKGQNLFANKCNSCHNFNYDGIGPQLAGITSENSVDWIKNFIRDPKKVVESGDTTAQKLFNKYKTLMPSFAYLPDEEIDAILAFIHSKKKLERPVAGEDTHDIKNPIPDTIKSSDLLVDLALVTQIPRSSDQPPFTSITKLDYQPIAGY